MESVTLMMLWLGLSEIKKMNAEQLLEVFEKYGIKN